MNTQFSRILLIDDMPSIHEDFRKVLTPNRGSASLDEAESVLFGSASSPRTPLELDCASSGEEGLRLLKAAALEGRPYALAFVDMRMPAGWDGVRTIEELWREDGELQVVICTAYSDNPLEQALGRLGSPDRLLVLKKPFDPIEVIQLARALVAKRRVAHEAATHLSNLERVLHEVQQAAEELRRRNHDLEAVQKNVSQNLRSPLAAIGILSSLLTQELGGHRSDKVDEYLDQMRNGARCGELLIDGVLSLTEVVVAQPSHESLDLTRMGRELIDEERNREPQRQVSISIQDGLRAWGDSQLVRVALKHLLGNAWKFTGRQKIAAITFGADFGAEGDTVFFVRDSGCGFDMSRADHLFQKFQRLHEFGEYPGGGVGLATVGRIIERHGGQIWADSRPEHGTTVYFTLPSAVPR
ncbi:MAG TPA: ATP-binding protein [Ramlibacter sp.]|uniref:ATP-binding protein n=1 Tax=Ramlibacter sp. TaxID=1917967 RepID=UPI002BE2F7F1|nr:ATP-binding protein [Ramlibacter sp.]HVZ44813.1 ATP-binding protein [Ramlibacter sp.]